MKYKKYSVFNPANFYTFFKCTNEDKKNLLDFQLFLLNSGSYKKIIESPRFAPSNTWLDWLSETYIGFSSNQRSERLEIHVL